ncbi:hypothetical protein cyc_00638 [Cyclospora cayetanensis]|uniref:Uncharacterized protein n=1 Tax=Cyclospora cayetanensis TaxID=88456 RepID=A0A1D3CTJ5_9EIME|nr:hypothetical protein cyc_00638 [Cyclospora cayetanensis]
MTLWGALQQRVVGEFFAKVCMAQGQKVCRGPEDSSCVDFPAKFNIRKGADCVGPRFPPLSQPELWGEVLICPPPATHRSLVASLKAFHFSRLQADTERLTSSLGKREAEKRTKWGPIKVSTRPVVLLSPEAGPKEKQGAAEAQAAEEKRGKEKVGSLKRLKEELIKAREKKLWRILSLGVTIAVLFGWHQALHRLLKNHQPLGLEFAPIPRSTDLGLQDGEKETGKKHSKELARFLYGWELPERPCGCLFRDHLGTAHQANYRAPSLVAPIPRGAAAAQSSKTVLHGTLAAADVDSVSLDTHSREHSPIRHHPLSPHVDKEGVHLGSSQYPRQLPHDMRRTSTSAGPPVGL